MNPVVAVIGCGGIGMRHVEALGRLTRAATVYAVDLRAEAAARACELFQAAKQQAQGAAAVEPRSAISALPPVIDLAIVATTAQHRLAAIEELLQAREVKALILEKFLFARPSDYHRANDVLENLGDSVWVNCSRRTYPAYREVAKHVVGSSFIDMHVTGHAPIAPLGTAAVHFADLLAFLGGVPTELEVSVLEPALLPTKRGIDDFAGTLAAESRDRRLRLHYAARNRTEAPLTVYLEAERARYLIQEWCETAYVATPESSWRFTEMRFAVPYQSQLTHLIAEEILSSGSCNLTPYSESAPLHLSLLTPLLEAYRHLMGNSQIGSVPFT